ncbi:MAG: ribosome biogenesis factor YjgA [Candidatus Pelagadaptatus aseana]|uniref:ribosome biogenesis factor YjgA n=1 Tax=Candidatus Pelagadaptatus aseana TaxID=3120508 RepID=UPI0039B1AED7
MSDFEDFNNDEEPVVKSRTQIKKEMQELQDFGEKLVNLTDKQFLKIPLEGQLQIAITEARGMKHREGRRRQLQYIGKLMRSAELDDVRAAYERLQNEGQHSVRLHHQAEQWRDKLLSGDKSELQKFVSEFPQVEVQLLRQLIRNAQKETSQKKPPSSARKLFKLIREQLEE